MVVEVVEFPADGASPSAAREREEMGEGMAARVFGWPLRAAPPLLYIEEETWRRRNSTA